MLTLPNEILHDIARAFDPRRITGYETRSGKTRNRARLTLSSLSRVCTRLRLITLPLIFASLKFISSTDYSKDGFLTHDVLNNTYIARSIWYGVWHLSNAVQH